MALPGIRSAVINVNKKATLTQRPADGGGDSSSSVAMRAAESVRNASSASASNARAARGNNALGRQYRGSDNLINQLNTAPKPYTPATRGNDKSNYGVPVTIDYSHASIGLAGNAYNRITTVNTMGRLYSSAYGARPNQYAQLNAMQSAQIGAATGKSFAIGMATLVKELFNIGKSSDAEKVYEKASDALGNSSSPIKNAGVKDLKTASGIKSAVRNADNSEEVADAMNAAKDVKTNLKNDLSSIDLSADITSKLDGTIEGSDKSVKDVLAAQGINLDTDSIGKIDISSDDTSELQKATEAKLESVKQFDKALKEATSKIKDATENTQSELNQTNNSISTTKDTIASLDSQIKTLESSNVDGANDAQIATLKARLKSQQDNLQRLEDQKTKLEKELAEFKATSSALTGMESSVDDAQGKLENMKESIEDLKEVEVKAEKKKAELVADEEKKLGQLNNEANQLKAKIDKESDESKKAKLQKDYNKVCAEYNEIAANTVSTKYLGTSIGEFATPVDNKGAAGKGSGILSGDIKLAPSFENVDLGSSVAAQNKLEQIKNLPISAATIGGQSVEFDKTMHQWMLNGSYADESDILKLIASDLAFLS